MLAFNPLHRGGRVRLGVDLPLVMNGNVLLRVCDVWANRNSFETLSSLTCLVARSNPLTWEAH